jgi:hypothetical protein
MALVLCGCATQAQRQYQAIATGNREIVGHLTVCANEVYNAPEAASLRPHIPLDISQATLAQLSDQALATKPEIDAITLLYPRLKACQKAALDGLVNTMPGIVPILTKQYSAGDDDTILLIQGKLAWGERIRRARDRANNSLAAMQTEAHRVEAGLEQQHEAELGRRQAAAQALAQWAQTQQMINAVNRPVTTNCTGFGYSVQCVSQ